MIFRLDSNGVVAGYPKPIVDEFPGLPSDIDAALYWEGYLRWGTGHEPVYVHEPARTYFFKGEHYWRYEDKGLIDTYPRKIRDHWTGVPNDLDAAMVYGINGKTYFFKGKSSMLGNICSLWFCDKYYFREYQIISTICGYFIIKVASLILCCMSMPVWYCGKLTGT